MSGISVDVFYQRLPIASSVRMSHRLIWVKSICRSSSLPPDRCDVVAHPSRRWNSGLFVAVVFWAQGTTRTKIRHVIGIAQNKFKEMYACVNLYRKMWPFTAGSTLNPHFLARTRLSNGLGKVQKAIFATSPRMTPSYVVFPYQIAIKKSRLRPPARSCNFCRRVKFAKRKKEAKKIRNVCCQERKLLS